MGQICRPTVKSHNPQVQLLAWEPSSHFTWERLEPNWERGGFGSMLGKGLQWRALL